MPGEYTKTIEKSKINFFGFTDENTVGDLREFFNDSNNLEDIDKMFKYVMENRKEHGDNLGDSYDYLAVLLYALCKDSNEDLITKWKSNITNENYNFIDAVKYICFQENALRKIENFEDNCNYIGLVFQVCFTIYSHNFGTSPNGISYDTKATYAAEFLCLECDYTKMNDKDKRSFRNIANFARLRRKRHTFVSGKIDEIIKNGRKQLVLTGAPGTGKTYGVREYVANELGSNINDLDKNECFKFVQFHASYNYVDFVEGLKPATIGGSNTFVRMDGVFKAFCRTAAKDENKDKTYYFVIDEINRADLSSVFGELMFCLEESYRGKQGQVITQYHNLPTYRYVQNNNEQPSEEDNDYSVLKASLAVADRTYSVSAKGLLDLINCIDSNRAKKDNVEIIDNDVFADGFYIPENVIIIGTMNDIDRNVETFDFALRRRFRWIDIDADESILYILCSGNENDELYKHAKALNAVIANEKYLGKAFKLGQSYFAKYTAGESYGDYFDAELRPIIEEYVRGRNNADKFVDSCRSKFTIDNTENG